MSRIANLGRAMVSTPGEKAGPSPRASEPALYEAPNGGLGRRVSNRDARSHASAYGGDDAISTVMDCVDMYAQTASNAEYHFERFGRRQRFPDEPNSTDTRGQVDPALVELFDKPNRITDYTDLMELSVIDLLLAGEFFWYKHETDPLTGRPKELYRLSPALVEVHAGKTAPEGYTYNAPHAEPLELRPDEMVHVKRPNPHDPWRGLGVIAGDPRMYDIALAATESMAQYYEQGTRLSGVLESDRSIPPSTFEKVKAEFRALYGGQRNHHKVATLERGLKFRPISGTAAEADYKGSRTMSREDIMMAFKVPPPLMGDVASADRQAVAEAQRIFDNRVMRPFLNRIQRQVTFQLTDPAFSVKYVIDHEYVMPIQDKLDLAQAFADLPGVRVREVRDLIDLPPLAQGDPELAWIDDGILNLPGKDRAEGGHADTGDTATRGGRPPNRSNTVMFPDRPEDVPTSADIITTGSAEEAQKAIQRARGD